jgi:hypothetical protein
MGGVEVFRHYMRRITQRGRGQFDILKLEPETGNAQVRLRHSAMVDEAHRIRGRRVCYTFSAGLEARSNLSQQCRSQATSEGPRGLLRLRGRPRSLPVRGLATAVTTAADLSSLPLN